MHQSDMEVLLTALGTTAQIMDTQLQPQVLVVIADDLSKYPLTIVLAALKKVRAEATRFSEKIIIDTIHSMDGAPGPEEAWALMSRPESETTVITEQMAEAMQSAGPVLNEQGHIAARQVFKEAYIRILANARENQIQPRWFVSFGHDKTGRAAPIAEAIRAGKIELNNVLGLLSPETKVDLLQLTNNLDHPILVAHKQAQLANTQPLDYVNGRKHIENLRNLIRGLSQ